MESIYTIDSKNGKASGSLIFLHGSGDTGPGLGETVKFLLGGDARLPHIRILFPTAPLLPFTAYGGMHVNTWYDISDFTDDAIENKSHIETSAKLLKQIILNEVDRGIPLQRIAVAGFSRGGAMSYYVGYSFVEGLAGIGVLSPWLPSSSITTLSQEIKQMDPKSLPPLFQTHGGSDFVINKHLGEKTFTFFKSIGVRAQFTIYPSVGHEVRPQILRDLLNFIKNVIPQD